MPTLACVRIFRTSGVRLTVMNIVHPLHVEADPTKLTWLVGELRQDLMKKEESVALPEKTTNATASKGSEDDESEELSVDAMAKEVLEGVQGVWWASSKRSFMVTKPRLAYFRVTSRKGKDVRQDAVRQLDRALLFQGTGIKEKRPAATLGDE